MADQPAELDTYEVTIGYNTTTMKLTAEDAQDMANAGQGVKDSKGGEIKPEDGSFAAGEPVEEEPAPAKARGSAANKSRSAADADSK